jgi:hypothetical protein
MVLDLLDKILFKLKDKDFCEIFNLSITFVPLVEAYVDHTYVFLQHHIERFIVKRGTLGDISTIIATLTNGKISRLFKSLMFLDDLNTLVNNYILMASSKDAELSEFLLKRIVFPKVLQMVEKQEGQAIEILKKCVNNANRNIIFEYFDPMVRSDKNCDRIFAIKIMCLIAAPLKTFMSLFDDEAASIRQVAAGSVAKLVVTRKEYPFDFIVEVYIAETKKVENFKTWRQREAFGLVAQSMTSTLLKTPSKTRQSFERLYVFMKNENPSVLLFVHFLVILVFSLLRGGLYLFPSLCVPFMKLIDNFRSHTFWFIRYSVVEQLVSLIRVVESPEIMKWMQQNCEKVFPNEHIRTLRLMNDFKSLYKQKQAGNGKENDRTIKRSKNETLKNEALNNVRVDNGIADNGIANNGIANNGIVENEILSKRNPDERTSAHSGNGFHRTIDIPIDILLDAYIENEIGSAKKEEKGDDELTLEDLSEEQEISNGKTMTLKDLEDTVERQSNSSLSSSLDSFERQFYSVNIGKENKKLPQNVRSRTHEYSPRNSRNNSRSNSPCVLNMKPLVRKRLEVVLNKLQVHPMLLKALHLDLMLLVNLCDIDMNESVDVESIQVSLNEMNAELLQIDGQCDLDVSRVILLLKDKIKVNRLMQSNAFLNKI